MNILGISNYAQIPYYGPTHVWPHRTKCSRNGDLASGISPLMEKGHFQNVEIVQHVIC